MIELFAIINEGEVMEIYAKEKKKKFLALLQTFIKEIRNKESKLIREILISNYHVYYFEQDNFLFVLATQISTVSCTLCREVNAWKTTCVLWLTSSIRIMMKENSTSC